MKSLCLKSVVLCSFFLLGLTSCGGNKKENDLDVEIIPEKGTIIDFNMETCNSIEQNISASNPSRRYVSGPIVYFLRMSITWKKDYRLYLQNINIKFNSKDFTINCSLPMTELSSLFLFSNPDADEADKIDNNKAIFDKEGFTGKGTIYSYSGCKIACPVRLKNPNNMEVGGTGTLTIKGTSLNGETFERVKTNVTIGVEP